MLRFALSLIVWIASSPADADCGRPLQPQEPFSVADVVFRGTPRDIRSVTVERAYQNITPRGTEYHPPKGYTIVSFDVSRVWKGSAGSTFVMHMAWGGGPYGTYGFIRDVEFMVFAVKNDPAAAKQVGHVGVTFTAHGCGGTAPIAYPSSTAYLRFLGPGWAPRPVPRFR